MQLVCHLVYVHEYNTWYARRVMSISVCVGEHVCAHGHVCKSFPHIHSPTYQACSPWVHNLRVTRITPPAAVLQPRGIVTV